MTQTVAVLYGGRSAEREVSLSSGRECITALREAGFEVIPIEVTDDLPAVIHALTHPRPHAVFNALHGRYGEDGCIQGVLDWLGIPYTHSVQIDESGKITTFMVRDLFSDHNAGPKGHKFYEIIHLGEKYTLLKCHTKFLRKEDYVENLGMVRRPNKYMELYSYWVLAGNSLRPAGANKTAMKKAIPEKANRIDSYVKSKKLQLKKKEGLAQLMQLLEK